MRQLIALATISATLILTGCGEDRSHPNDPNAPNYTPPEVVYYNPVAVLDVNASGFIERDDEDNNTDTLRFRWTSVDDTLTFDGSESKDLDTEGNASIQDYTWAIELIPDENNETMSDTCLDQNDTGSILIIKVCDEIIDPGDEIFSVELTVKDDENKTASTKKTITIF